MERKGTALIVCPNCGKQSNDTTNRCVHCGDDMKNTEKTPVAKKDYTDLPQERQNALLHEFETAYPQYSGSTAKRKREKYQKRLKRVLILCPIFSLTLLAIQSLSKLSILSYSTALGMIVAALLLGLLISLVLIVAFVMKRNKFRYKYLLNLKLFQQWLARYKKIPYNVQFSAKEESDKKRFDNLDLSFDIEKALCLTEETMCSSQDPQCENMTEQETDAYSYCEHTAEKLVAEHQPKQTEPSAKSEDKDIVAIWKARNPKEVKIHTGIMIGEAILFGIVLIIILVLYFSVLNRWISAGKSEANPEESLYLLANYQYHLKLTQDLLIYATVVFCLAGLLEDVHNFWIPLRASAWVRHSKIDLKPYLLENREKIVNGNFQWPSSDLPQVIYLALNPKRRNLQKFIMLLECIVNLTMVIIVAVWGCGVATDKIRSVMWGSKLTIHYTALIVAFIFFALFITIRVVNSKMISSYLKKWVTNH